MASRSVKKKGGCASGVEQAVGKQTSSQKWFWGDIVVAFVKSRKVCGGYQGTVYENPSFRIFWLYLFVKVVSSHSWFCKVFTTNRKRSRLEDSLPAGELRFKVAGCSSTHIPENRSVGREEETPAHGTSRRGEGAVSRALERPSVLSNKRGV